MKVILIDDEPLALDYLELQLKKISKVEVIAKLTYFNMEKHFSLLEKVQVVFMDIEMPQKNGLELAEQLLEVNSSLLVVFVTAYQEYALKAFELNALDYIMKPLQLDRLKITLERIESKLQAQQKLQPLAIGDPLQISVFGDLTFSFKNKDMPNIKWRTAKSQELFLYLLHNLEKFTHKTELIDILWPEMEEEKAYQQLYTAIYHTRKTLHPLREYLSIKNQAGGYKLLLQNSRVDIIEWEQMIQMAPPLQNEAVAEKYEKMVGLYLGSYLQNYDYIWVESERYRLDQLWIKTAYQLANWYKDNNEIEKAETWYLKICSKSPEEEHAHFSLMKLYATFNYGVLVDHQYAQLKKAFEKLDLSISPLIEKWYMQYRNKSIPL